MAPPAALLALAGPIQRIAGYLHGLRYPSLRIPLNLAPMPRLPDVRRLDALLGEALPPARQPGLPPERAVAPIPAGANGPATLLQVLLRGLDALHRSAGTPVCDSARLVLHDSRLGRAVVLMPCLPSAFGEMTQAVHWLIAVADCFARGLDPRPLLADAGKALQALGARNPDGTNTPRFLRAAHTVDIPFIELPGRVYQYGQGRRARWLNSTASDETSQISVMLARDKAMTATVLRHNALPVPDHVRVRDCASAIQAAEQLGYPVVVKPLAKDGGVGVTAGIGDAASLRKAWESARQHGDTQLVEKHVEGRDYRLTVFHDELVWAIERVPGGVTGDGQQSVAALLAERNAANPFKDRNLVLDDEALGLLRQASLSPDSVPAAGQFVRLRSIANIAAGGTSRPVLDQVHPDNRQLAVRAAQALRLDLAGVDLIIPDISRSWLESGAAICEVNSQPQLGILTSAHLYPHILQCLLGGNGRIPVIVVLGAAPGHPLIDQLHDHLTAHGRRPGSAGNGGIRIGAELLASPPLDSYAAGHLLLLNRQVDCLLLAINDLSTLQLGLPVDRIDLLLIAGRFLDSQAASEGERFDELLATLALACRGPLLLAPGLTRPAAELAQIETFDPTLAQPNERVIALLDECLQRVGSHAPPPSETRP